MAVRIARLPLVSALLVSCWCAALLDPPEPITPELVAEAAAVMAALPRLADAERSMREIVDEIGAATGFAWRWEGERAGTPCEGRCGAAGGLLVDLPSYRADAALPDAP